MWTGRICFEPSTRPEELLGLQEGQLGKGLHGKRVAAGMGRGVNPLYFAPMRKAGVLCPNTGRLGAVGEDEEGEKA